MLVYQRVSLRQTKTIDMSYIYMCIFPSIRLFIYPPTVSIPTPTPTSIHPSIHLSVHESDVIPVPCLHLQVFRCVSKGSSTQSGATRQARPLALRGSAHAARTEATQQSHRSMEPWRTSDPYSFVTSWMGNRDSFIYIYIYILTDQGV